MIWHAKFTGRKVGSIGIVMPITTYAYGNNKEEAEAYIYEHYEHVMFIKLEHRFIVTVGDCKPGNYIIRIENGKTIGATNPHQSTYRVQEHNPIVCSGEYANHITCRDITGILVPVAADLQCIVEN